MIRPSVPNSSTYQQPEPGTLRSSQKYYQVDQLVPIFDAVDFTRISVKQCYCEMRNGFFFKNGRLFFVVEVVESCEKNIAPASSSGFRRSAESRCVPHVRERSLEPSVRKQLQYVELRSVEENEEKQTEEINFVHCAFDQFRLM